MTTVLSVIESPTFPNHSALFKRLELDEIQVFSMRRAIAAIKKSKPDFLFAEFYYGYGNNYAGVNVSNLDVLLSSLPLYSPATRTAIFVQPRELQHVDKLRALFPIHAVFLHGATQSEIKAFLAS